MTIFLYYLTKKNLPETRCVLFSQSAYSHNITRAGVSRVTSFNLVFKTNLWSIWSGVAKQNLTDCHATGSDHSGKLSDPKNLSNNSSFLKMFWPRKPKGWVFSAKMLFHIISRKRNFMWRPMFHMESKNQKINIFMCFLGRWIRPLHQNKHIESLEECDEATYSMQVALYDKSD